MKNLFTKAPAVFTGAAALLAGGLMAAPASAQGEAESMMVLGGYTNYTISFTEHPEGQIGEQSGDLHIFNNTEIFFNGSAETDGGLQVSARVELEGHSENDQIDEHYLTVSGGFGSVEIGANDGADERLAKGIFYNSTAVDLWYWNDISVPTAYYRAPGIYSDGMGVTYTSPSLGGATFAIGYKPSREDGARRGVTQSGDENVFSFGAKYEGDMDGVTVAASFGYGTWDAAATKASVGDSTVTTAGAPELGEVTPAKPAETFDVWGIGVNVGFGDTTLYARYQDEEYDPKDVAGTAPTKEIQIGSLAVSHALGPVKLGLGWVQTTIEEGTQENEDTMVLGSVDYTLGSGVTLGGYVAWGETEQTGAGATATKTGAELDAENSESATALGVALNLAF